MALLLGHFLTLLLSNLVALLLGYLPALLLRHLLARLLLHIVALLLGNHLGDWLLILLTPLDRHWSAHLDVGCSANLLRNSISVGHRLGGTFLLGHLLALSVRHVLAHLLGFIPTLLAWLIPALLLAIHM